MENINSQLITLQHHNITSKHLISASEFSSEFHSMDPRPEKVDESWEDEAMRPARPGRDVDQNQMDGLSDAPEATAKDDKEIF